jgi:Calcium-dependent channel, 7TM region, putative phosphate
VQEFEKYVNNPREILRFLALALPGRSGYFMQLLIVSTCLGTLIELFRVVAIFQSIARANFGRRLTEKQRSRTIGILRPLSCVDKIYFSRMQSRFLLYFMVMFVYTTISPLVNWLCMILFIFVGSVYRYQFVFNYPKTPDSGGKIWLHFMRTIFACILIAQLALLSFLALRGSEIAALCMLPLLIVTCIFISHVNEYYCKLGEFLPAKECLSQDMANDDDDMDYNEFLNTYKNPSLMARFEDVNWMPNQSSSPKLDSDESEESIRLDLSDGNI